MNAKKILILIIAIFLVSGITAQNHREYKIEDDGFEWYHISRDEPGKGPFVGVQDKYGNTIIQQKYGLVKYEKGIFVVMSKDNLQYGCLDIKGNIIVPTEYDFIMTSYIYKHEPMVINVKKDDYYGVYDKTGKCLIPVSKRYKSIERMRDFRDETGDTEYYVCKTVKKGKDKVVLYDASGKMFFESKNYYEFINVFPEKSGRCALVEIDVNHVYSFINQFDEIWKPSWASISGGSYWVNDFEVKTDKDNRPRKITQTEINKVCLSVNLIDRNKVYFANLEKSSSHTNSSVSNNSSTSNSNSGNNTTTIHVEHHHDPVPVQQWQACFACGGMGTMGCTNCGGGGTKYIGDRLHRCSRCNGRGIIPCNVCYGNKGQYITVYQ